MDNHSKGHPHQYQLLLDDSLPVLPSSVRYYDDFEDKYNIINKLYDDEWKTQFDGKKYTVKFIKVPQGVRRAFKHIAIDMLGRLDVKSAIMFLDNILRSPDSTILAISESPQKFRDYWILNVSNWAYMNALATRTAIHSMCRLGLGSWTTDFSDYVSLLPAPKLDTYKTVRMQECFLPLDHQSLIIEYLDEVAILASKSLTAEAALVFRDASLLILSHQFGLRPGQIARIQTADVRSYNPKTLHIAVPLGKQRGKERKRLITRRIKTDWVQIFNSYIDASSYLFVNNDYPTHLFFRMPPKDVSLAIAGLTEKITGQRWSATDLRHSAAQRLVDSGVSHISLSEFMGHATTLTANVYFDASPTQTQRVNQALALSNIYSNVAEVAKTRTIDKTALLGLHPDQQIGGVPHGIPIAGIGGCSTGQSLCTKNPVLSCYTCRKFLPLSDPKIHESVVESLRPVVTAFATASRFNDESPAYTQLRRMFQAALKVAEEVRLIQLNDGTKPA
ncbi:tyrosine-type recombinase/integrase [Pseudomonas fluorescens]|uniref:tyrosine-type recombinase/integrase n=1 Tax=Pseudomonas fluorescens TaxID=294 RepID=UPI00177A76C4|nr:tyrosine-type recombinase/integrase [Pseudomonas fluorescens]MBD8774062.1 tyrosine-type recombinase/integrase [Pseudomonas fluorescens]MBD8780908.1 tyrosine-type recombinase/integrase [Pseudomonas fluorescens]MBD8796785.1 tyrosine-type recombinase/integrase [Pseudomonas fluorescens]